MVTLEDYKIDKDKADYLLTQYSSCCWVIYKMIDLNILH